jgi:antiviral helicase SKI2
MVKICSIDYSTENEAKYEQYFKSFPYTLSPFQKHSIEAIVEGNHCLVTAHTGSGKTLPAEFAIQHFTDIGKKIIYCSPIKALSNQKYYEFSNKYPHISFGLYTGDIKTNPEAQVIIMTTEILMNYLFVYNKPENDKTTINNNLDFNINIENELACVVFDEVHYINDAERGQVWEKTMLMLPHKVQLVMLSATIDNPEGFAGWIETQRLGIKTLSENDKIVYLASTTKRVVPLTEYCFLTTTEAVFKGMKDKELEKQIRDNTNTLLMLQDSNGKFVDTTINTVSKMLKL